MAITVPQINKGDFIAAVASLSVSLTSGISAGSIMVTAGSYNSTSSTSPTIANDKGDLLTTIIPPQTLSIAPAFIAYMACFLAPTTGAKTVTITYAGTNPSFGDQYVWEVAGLNFPKVDRSAILAGNSVTAYSQVGFLSTPQQAAIAYSCSGNSSSLITTRNWTGDGQTTNTGSDGDHYIAAQTAPVGIQWNEGPAAQWYGLMSTFMSNPIPEWLYKV